MEKIVVLEHGTYCNLSDATIWTITEEGSSVLINGSAGEFIKLEEHHILSKEWVEDCLKSK